MARATGQREKACFTGFFHGKEYRISGEWFDLQDEHVNNWPSIGKVLLGKVEGEDVG